MAAAGTTQIIKQSICLRAKYKVGKKIMSPFSVVPHPVNRGGEPVRSSRTMQLNGTVVKAGYDSVEANCSAVAVEEKPAVAGGGTVYLSRMISRKRRSLTPTCCREAAVLWRLRAACRTAISIVLCGIS